MTAQGDANKRIIDLLKKAYYDELETVMNYIANSVNLDGLRGHEVGEALDKDIEEELGHARQLARRIKVIGGLVPGSDGFSAGQKALQPPKDTTDVESVIKGVIDAEESAISTYKELIDTCEGVDYVTQDLAITLLADEEEHRREFVGFLAEFQKRK